MLASPVPPTLRALLASTTAQLAAHGTLARREAETLICAALELPRSRLITDPDWPVSDALAQRVAQWTQRRATGEPLAYLMGEREFWSRSFMVDAAVLVPRPETELLIERALLAGDEVAGVEPAQTSVRAVDLGTGSGAIALTLALERPTWKVHAVERSDSALRIARANAARLEAERPAANRVVFHAGNWFEPLGEQQFELIVSNPPYVAADDPVLEADGLRHEPRAALTPGTDAFADLQYILEHAPRHLADGGVLLLEHGSTQGAELRARLVARGFAHVVSHRDLAGHERVTEGRWLPAPSP
ncbi:MAG: peptide chain release factor N(5)-glutamine methyltransferase [Sinobacteraceae bacterium]|nr:peptide chain release factor N(5)-glutamine methyltransferase [Nevskiaceae bacterium]